MRRVPILLSIVFLLIAACGDDAVTTQASTATSEATTTQPVVTSEATTTTAATATTEAATTTTTTTMAPTTTTTMPPVLDDPLLPEALHRTLIPWDQVDGSWALVLFSNVYGYGEGESPADDIVVAYLVGPDGTPYEITHWPAASAPTEILDVQPDGRRALLGIRVEGIPAEVGSAELLDLTTGSLTAVHGGAHTTFTRPTGENLMVHTHPDTIEKYSIDGSHLASFGGWGGFAIDYGIPERPWLYGPTGLSLVINPPDGGGISAPRLFDNQGNHLRDLDTPGDDCVALRWWSDTTVLMRCMAPNPGSWDVFTISIVDTTGTEGPEALTTAEHAAPSEALDGYVDAIRAGDTVMIQGLLAVGSGAFPIARLGPGGAPVPLGDDVAGQLVAAGPATVSVHLLGCCDEIYGGLIIYNHSGGEIARLEAPSGVVGVEDAHGVGGV